MTKTQLEAENQRLQARIDELGEEIDRLKQPLEDVDFDIEMAFENFDNAVKKAANDLKAEIKKLVSQRKTPA